MRVSPSSLADRAKAIKTSAVINESPTEKLIRELREENQKLLDMLKKGGVGTGSFSMGASEEGRNESMGGKFFFEFTTRRKGENSTRIARGTAATSQLI